MVNWSILRAFLLVAIDRQLEDAKVTSLSTFSLFYCMKQIDSMFSVCLFSSRPQKSSKYGKNIRDLLESLRFKDENEYEI